MNILIVYQALNRKDRSTFGEHLNSFSRYSHNNTKCYYLNLVYGIPPYINTINFDLIIYHYYFFDPNVRSNRFTRQEMLLKYKVLKELRGYKVAIPQDEYRYSDRVSDFFMDFGVKTVFTCLPESEWQKVYPRERTGLDHYVTVFTGYVDEVTLGKVTRWACGHKARKIDVGYRGSPPPYWLGRHGLIKQQLIEQFSNFSVKHSLRLNLSNDYADTLYGDDWYKFLCTCRVVIGCEGGASLHDPDGSLKERVERYVNEHPYASFDEVEYACFPGIDGNLKLFAVSPRHFEACMTRTCQALVEGEYGGILRPGVHYIEIKKDWSNIADVIEQIEDVDHCERIADNAYKDIIESGLYTYGNFVQLVLNHVRRVHQPVTSGNLREGRYLKRLELRERYPWVFEPATFFSMDRVKYVIYRMLIRLNLYSYYKKCEATLAKKLYDRISLLVV